MEKRKRHAPAPPTPATPSAVREEFAELDLSAAEEDSIPGSDLDASTDSEGEEFPEIDASDHDLGGDSDEEEEEEEEEEDESDAKSISGSENVDNSAHDSENKSEREEEDGDQGDGWQRSALTGELKKVYPEIDAVYDSDSSTEDAPNRVGNVPLHWYDDLPHIGYDVNGNKLLKPATTDELDKFLETVEDPDSWVSAKDELLGKQAKLTDEELDIIRRLQQGEIPDASYDPYEPMTEWFTGPGKEMVTPLTARPEPKRRFVPSKWEHKKVMKIVRAIREGRILPRAPASQRPQFFNLWSDADEPRADHPMHMPAPKLALPNHDQSYNPPAEYLFTDKERKGWLEADREDRKTDFIPAKHDSLRLVPGYQNFVQERFERCLDLYLAPRIRRSRVDIDPESLVPKLPSPKELRPFPTTTAVVYSHPRKSRVRCCAVDGFGNWIATGAEDGVLRLWELATGRCAAKWDLNQKAADQGPVFSVEWCPNRSLPFFAAASSGRITVIAPPSISSATVYTSILSHVLSALNSGSNPTQEPSKAIKGVKWVKATEKERASGILLHVELPGTPKQVAWHGKGDYFATVCGDVGSNSVLIHQLTKHRSQAPFKRAAKGSAVQRVAFHPLKPQLFVATQRYVRLYDLAAQALVKTLTPGLKWISSFDVHPGGDNIIVGSYDKRLVWFDMDLSSKPYKTLRYHSRAIRSVVYHKSYPLFASTADDGTANVFHGTVFSDLSQNPLVVPLKVLRGHTVTAGLGILDAKWHPSEPWLVTAGSDGDVRLWTT